MTIGRLSQRAGIPVKTLRAYEQMGLIYTAGRSQGNYRLFGDEALWCVGVVTRLRELGLTLTEIQELATAYLGPSAGPIGPRLASLVDAARSRTEQRIAELQRRLELIRGFQSERAAELGGAVEFNAQDPRRGAAPTA